MPPICFILETMLWFLNFTPVDRSSPDKRTYRRVWQGRLTLAAVVCIALSLLLAACTNLPQAGAANHSYAALYGSSGMNAAGAERIPKSPVSTAPPTFTPRPAIIASPVPNPLAGVKIGIDPGHQLRANMGSEPIAPNSDIRGNKVTGGTKGIVTGISEHVFALELALILKDILEDCGAEVFMTRTTADVNITNVERAQLVNESGCSSWIRLHADGFYDRKASGVSMLIPSTQYSSRELCDKSKLLGKCILDRVAEKTGARNRGLIERSNISGFNWSQIPVCLIECGFMSNANEDRLLAQDSYRRKIAEGIAEGFAEYYSSIQ